MSSKGKQVMTAHSVDSGSGIGVISPLTGEPASGLKEGMGRDTVVLSVMVTDISPLLVLPMM